MKLRVIPAKAGTAEVDTGKPIQKFKLTSDAKMKKLPTDDPLFGRGTIRIDGSKIHPAYLFEVKKPEESKYPWDYSSPRSRRKMRPSRSRRASARW